MRRALGSLAILLGAVVVVLIWRPLSEDATSPMSSAEVQAAPDLPSAAGAPLGAEAAVPAVTADADPADPATADEQSPNYVDIDSKDAFSGQAVPSAQDAGSLARVLGDQHREIFMSATAPPGGPPEQVIPPPP